MRGRLGAARGRTVRALGGLMLMKRFSTIELGSLVLATVLFLGGLSCAIWPRAELVVHFTNDVVGWPGSSIEAVSPTGARVYGILAMLLGFGIASLATYRGKNCDVTKATPNKITGDRL